MRMISSRASDGRLADEAGATATILALVLVLLLGLMALSIDGGLMWTKYRRARTANDAAALAAAISCARNEGLTAANGQANSTASANMADAGATAANAYAPTPACGPSGGTVTVRYGGMQQLFFAPAVGLSSPRAVITTATATWGGVGAEAGSRPLVVDQSQLTGPCGIPSGSDPTQPCVFTWDGSTPSQWGLIDPRTSSWGISRDASCPNPKPNPNTTGSWLTNGYTPTLTMTGNPTYVCASNGNIGNNVDSAMTGLANAHAIVFLPVGTIVPGAHANDDKYAVVGFVKVQIISYVRHGKVRTMTAKWLGFESGGGDVMGGNNFGIWAVTLTK